MVKITRFSIHLNPRGHDVDSIPIRSLCANCGELVSWKLSGVSLKTKSECSLPTGITTVVDLKVPSGKMIVTDDLRDIYQIDASPRAGYNSLKGRAQVTQAMGELGCAYGAVGNSSPDLYQTGESSFVIANLEVYGEDDQVVNSESLPPSLASICTDLWAYSIADYDDWVSKGGVFDPDSSMTVLEVPAGVYRFTHLNYETSFVDSYGQPTVFARVERITTY